MKYKKLYLLAILAAFVVLLTSSLKFLNFSSKTSLEEQHHREENIYPVNENGQTYGPNYGSPYIKDPDLMVAIGVDGTKGYVLSSDLDSNPRTPEEAIELQKNRKSPIFIPLYDKDGKTIIGTFKVGNSTLKF